MLLYHQDRCLRYAAPADLVVYESEAGAAGELLKRPGYSPMAIVDPGSYGNPGPVAAYVPGALRDLDRAIAGGAAGARAAVLFLGELRAKNGERRLVIVQRGATSYAPLFEVFDLHVTVFEPATLRRDLRVVPPSDAKMMIWNGPVSMLMAKDLRFYAGQRVAGESDRFTLRYSMEGREGVVEGKLSEDGTDVAIEVKSGPAVGSAWAHPIGLKGW